MIENIQHLVFTAIKNHVLKFKKKLFFQFYLNWQYAHIKKILKCNILNRP